MAIVKRLDKGSALTYAELDGNFDHLVAEDADIRTDIAADFETSSGSSLVGFIQDNPSASPTTVQAKLREFHVSPEDFGASGDDSSADTAAFNAIRTYANE